MKLFKTKDFYLACFLKAKGIKLHNAKGLPGEIYFVFQCVDGMDDIVKNFYNETETITAIKFVNAIRDIKALMHNINMRGE